MVSANPDPGQFNNSRVRPIPLGNDNLQFKHDIAIMQQLDQNGKYFLDLRETFRFYLFVTRRICVPYLALL